MSKLAEYVDHHVLCAAGGVVGGVGLALVVKAFLGRRRGAGESRERRQRHWRCRAALSTTTTAGVNMAPAARRVRLRA